MTDWTDDAPMTLRRVGRVRVRLTGARRMQPMSEDQGWHRTGPSRWARDGATIWHDGRQWTAMARGRVWSLAAEDDEGNAREALMGEVDRVMGGGDA